MANEKINRCRRSNSPISDPNAVYGPVCAKIMGTDVYGNRIQPGTPRERRAPGV